MTLALTPSVTGIVGRVVRRGTEGYEHLRRGAIWHAGVPERFPEVIVFAAGEADVVAAVKLASSLGLHVSVRSGGHSWSGNHLRDDTLLIDLSNLRQVEIDKESMTATVQPGVRGSEVLACCASSSSSSRSGTTTPSASEAICSRAGSAGRAGSTARPACR
jgi:FAD/FMN-containing dehydrogenase